MQAEQGIQGLKMQWQYDLDKEIIDEAASK